MFYFHSRFIQVVRSCRCVCVAAFSILFLFNLSALQAAQVEQTTQQSPSVDVVALDSSAEALFEASGLKKLVEQIPSSTATSFEGALTAEQLPDLFAVVDEESIRQVVANSFKQETFDKYLIKELSNGMSAESRRAMLDWYASKLGTRVVQAELDNSLLTSGTRFEEYQRFLQRYPVDVVREQLVINLDYTMKSTESAVEMMTNIQVAFNLSLARFMPEGYRLSRQEIIEMVERNHEALWAQYTTQTIEVLLFTYQSLSNDELAQLDEVLGSDAGQEFVVAINNGIRKGMFASSLDLGDGLGALLDDAPLSPGI